MVNTWGCNGYWGCHRNGWHPRTKTDVTDSDGTKVGRERRPGLAGQREESVRRPAMTSFLRATWSWGGTCLPQMCRLLGHLRTSPHGSLRSELLGPSTPSSLLHLVSLLQEAAGPGHRVSPMWPCRREQSNSSRRLWGPAKVTPLCWDRSHTRTVQSVRAMRTFTLTDPPLPAHTHAHTPTRRRSPESPLCSLTIPTPGCCAALPSFIESTC